MDFLTGIYNSVTKIWSSPSGDYYIAEDNCGASPLSQTCNTQSCEWGPWLEDSTGKSSCQHPCSSYVFKQYSLCPNGNCDRSGSRHRIRYLPCGEVPCATRGLTPYGSCSTQCGGGTQTRTCRVNPMPLNTNLPAGYSIDVPANFATDYNQSAATFSNPYDLPDQRF